jgi:hypothetical protein
MINETFKAVGTLRIVLTDENGNVKVDRTENNIITTVGRTYIAQRITSGSPALMGWMAVGTSAAAEAAGNTQLGSEIVGGRAVATPSNTANVANFAATFGAGAGTGAIVEAGIFNASAINSGVMLNRVTFAVVNKGALDTLAISWNITVA